MALSSGSPFDSSASLPKPHTSSRLSAPQQSPQLTAQKYQSSPNRQPPKQQTRQQAQYNQARTNSHQAAPSYRAPAIANSYAYMKAQPQTRQSAPALVTKHFYIHAAPDEPEEPARRRYVQLGENRKNYKSDYQLIRFTFHPFIELFVLLMQFDLLSLQSSLLKRQCITVNRK